eukprot:15431617-Alexandrium_andersonii.AAC.1
MPDAAPTRPAWETSTVAGNLDKSLGSSPNQTVGVATNLLAGQTCPGANPPTELATALSLAR